MKEKEPMSPAKKEVDMTTYSGRIAAKIRALREDAGLSVEEVVKNMAKNGYSVSVPTFYKWENGERKFNLDAIPAFAKAMKIKNLQSIFPEK